MLPGIAIYYKQCNTGRKQKSQASGKTNEYDETGSEKSWCVSQAMEEIGSQHQGFIFKEKRFSRQQ